MSQNQKQTNEQSYKLKQKQLQNPQDSLEKLTGFCAKNEYTFSVQYGADYNKLTVIFDKGDSHNEKINTLIATMREDGIHPIGVDIPTRGKEIGIQFDIEK